MRDRNRPRLSPFRERLGRHPLDVREHIVSKRDMGLGTYIVSAAIAGGAIAAIGFILLR